MRADAAPETAMGVEPENEASPVMDKWSGNSIMFFVGAKVRKARTVL